MFGKSFNSSASIFYGTYRPQLLATLTVSLMAYSFGISLGWVAPMLFKMQSEDSPLPFTISVEEASWIGSVQSFGGMCGTIVFGFMLNRFGSKVCLYLLAVPHIIFWSMLLIASDVSHIYIARLIGGITGGAIFLVAPIFASEISDPLVRGAFGTLFCLTLNIGLLSGQIIASYVPFFVIPCVILVLPVLFIIFTTRFPETPRFLLRKGLTQAAEDSYKFYHNLKGNNKEDFLKLKSDFNEIKASIEASNAKEAVSIKDFLEKRSLRAIGIGIVITFFSQFSGLPAIINYSSMIFANTGSALHPNINTIIVGVTQIVGGSVSIVLIDKLGRKILLLLSTGGMCLALTSIGVYSYLYSNGIDLTSWTWLPLVLMSLIVFSSNVGITAVTFVVLVEILPPKIRSLGSAFFMFLIFGMAFVLLKAVPILMISIGIYGVMWICGGVAGFGFFFTLTVLKETKGKSIDE